MDASSWSRVIDVHLNGAYHVTKPAFAVMKEQKYGVIMFTTPAAAIFGNFGQTTTARPKWG